MKHVECVGHGGPEVMRLTSGAASTPQPGEVLIRVHAAGINRPDILQRKGLYPPPSGASPILGLEVAGEITAVGQRNTPLPFGMSVGSKICALLAGGGYATECVAPAEQCLPLPTGFSFEQGAAIPETFFTVWANLFMRARLNAGESVLIHGGTSGIGTTAIQLANVFGATVFATAGSDAKVQACLDLGAQAAINYNTNDFESEIRKANGSRGIDVILDMIAGDYFSKNVNLLAEGGRLVQIATQKGEQVSLSLRTLMAKGGVVTGSLLRPRSAAQKGVIAQELYEKVWSHFADGSVKVIIDSVFELNDVAKAHKKMESSEHIGKIVLKMPS